MEETSFWVGQCHDLPFGVLVGLISKLTDLARGVRVAGRPPFFRGWEVLKIICKLLYSPTQLILVELANNGGMWERWQAYLILLIKLSFLCIRGTNITLYFKKDIIYLSYVLYIFYLYYYVFNWKYSPTQLNWIELANVY